MTLFTDNFFFIIVIFFRKVGDRDHAVSISIYICQNKKKIISCFAGVFVLDEQLEN